jgi:hypothetical protein
MTTVHEAEVERAAARSDLRHAAETNDSAAYLAASLRVKEANAKIRDLTEKELR